MRLAIGVIGVAGYALAGLAVVSLLLGAFLAWNTLAFTEDARDTQGKVIGHFESVTDGKTRYTPRVEFVDATGTRYEFRSQMSATAQRLALGAAVPVRYRVSQPTDARVALFVDNWLGATVALILGTIAALGAWVLVRSSKRELAR